MNGDFISLSELRVKAKSLTPANGKRTSNIEEVLGEEAIVWHCSPVASLFWNPNEPAFAPSRPQSETPSGPISRRKPVLGFDRTVSTSK